MIVNELLYEEGEKVICGGGEIFKRFSLGMFVSHALRHGQAKQPANEDLFLKPLNPSSQPRRILA